GRSGLGAAPRAPAGRGRASGLAGREPLAGALHTSAGSGGELRSVSCSPGPSLRANVNGPVVVVILACREPPFVAAAPPGTPTVTSGVSRVTAMCIFAGWAVGEPECTSMSIVAVPPVPRSTSYATADGCAVPLIFTGPAYGGAPAPARS